MLRGTALVGSPVGSPAELRPLYRAALLDWLACAHAGAGERATRIAAETADRPAALGTAGHALDFDDTWTPGLAHLSAPTAPAALSVAAELGRSTGAALDAYAAGWEVMAVLAGHAHPALYERGLHPTATVGAAGAAVAAGSLLELDQEALMAAVALGLARAGGLQAAFGGDGKALQVGAAISAGVLAARQVVAGAVVDAEAMLAGLLRAWGVGPLPVGHLPGGEREAAIRHNWIKAYPCCLQTHTAIEAALTVDAGQLGEGALLLRVHPLSLAAAGIAEPEDGLQAKFSIPYLSAWALLRGAPDLATFGTVDPGIVEASRRISIEPDPELGQSEAVLSLDGYELSRVAEAMGSPSRPMSPAQLERKVADLAGPAAVGWLDDLERPAAELLLDVESEAD